jgi:hypothetical protein
MKAQAGGSAERAEFRPVSEEEEYMLEKMAEEYSGMKNDQTDIQKQSKLFDY